MGKPPIMDRIIYNGEHTLADEPVLETTCKQLEINGWICISFQTAYYL